MPHGTAIMGRTIKITISGRGAGTDAPSADDLLDQIRDYLDILRDVEEAVAEDGRAAIDWRVVDAKKASPIEFALEAFPRQYAVNVDRRATEVARVTAAGFAMLQERAERPPYFRDRTLVRAERMFERVTNGLDFSGIDFGDDLPGVVITDTIARTAARNAAAALRAVRERPYREFGSIEGLNRGVFRDSKDRQILHITHRITGKRIKCILSGSALEKVEQHLIGEVLRGRRVRVIGIIFYSDLGKVSYVDATDIEFPRPRSDLPSANDILDENFTGGLRTEEYLERLRDGSLN
jgi:hypothetical protein